MPGGFRSCALSLTLLAAVGCTGGSSPSEPTGPPPGATAADVQAVVDSFKAATGQLITTAANGTGSGIGARSAPVVSQPRAAAVNLAVPFQQNCAAVGFVAGTASDQPPFPPITTLPP